LLLTAICQRRKTRPVIGELSAMTFPILPPNSTQETEMPEQTIEQLNETIKDLCEALKIERSNREADARKAAATEQKLSEIQQKLTTVTRQHHDGVLNTDFSRIGVSMGVLPDALPDFLAAVPNAGWIVNEEGAPELRDPKTGRPVYNGSGDPITPEEWAAQQAQGRQGYLFQGGRRQAEQAGNGGDLRHGEPNPFADATWNDTEQARIINSGPDGMEKAKRLAAAAGTKVGAMPPGLRPKTQY
jgi:hypothetical protein